MEVESYLTGSRTAAQSHNADNDTSRPQRRNRQPQRRNCRSLFRRTPPVLGSGFPEPKSPASTVRTTPYLSNLGKAPVDGAGPGGRTGLLDPGQALRSPDVTGWVGFLPNMAPSDFEAVPLKASIQAKCNTPVKDTSGG